MSALAQLVRAKGQSVSGSDRFFDLGQLRDRQVRLEAQGIRIFPQDGSGVHSGVDRLVVSTAIETDNRDLERAQALGLAPMHRSQAPRGNLPRVPARDRRHRQFRQDDDHRHDRLDASVGRLSPDGGERRHHAQLRDGDGPGQRGVRRRRRGLHRGGRERRHVRELPAEHRRHHRFRARPQGGGGVAAALLDVRGEHAAGAGAERAGGARACSDCPRRGA